MRSFSLVLILLLTMGATGSAQAPLPAQTKLDPVSVARLWVTSAASAHEIPEPAWRSAADSGEKEDAAAVARARWLLADGLGVMVGSAAGAAWAGRERYCVYQELQLDKTAPRAVAAGLGVVGLGLSVFGAARLFAAPSELRSATRATRGRALGMVGSSLGAAVLTTLLVSVSAAPQAMQCMSS